MKKILLFICMTVSMIISGCAQPLMIHQTISPFDQQTYDNVPAVKYKNGFYLANEGKGEIEFIEGNQNISVISMYFMDDEPAGKNANQKFKNYQSILQPGFGFYCLEDALYVISFYKNVQGEFWYSLMRISCDGKEVKELFRIPFVPYGNFIIHENNVYLLESNEEMNMTNVHVFSMDGKEIKEIKNTEIDSFFVSDGVVYLKYASAGKFAFFNENQGFIFIENLDDGFVQSVSNGYVSLFVYEYDSNGNVTGLKSCYQSLDSLEPEVVFEGELLSYFDEEYLYTSQIRGVQKYRQYTLDGELVNEIVPSASCESEEDSIHSVYVWESDFTTICRVIGNEILAYSMNGCISCDVESGKCRYL